MALTVFTAFSHTPAMALLDAYALRGLKPRGRAYGPVRLWGSISFIVANLGAGLAFDLIDARNLIWLIVGVRDRYRYGADLADAAAADGCACGRCAAGRGRSGANPRFVAIVVAASLIQSSHAVYYGFSTIAWKAAGLRRRHDRSAVGARA